MGVTTNMKKPKTLYAAAFNLQGLYCTKPIKVTFDKNSKAYWDKTGDFDIKQKGLDDKNPCCIKFAHKNKDVVQVWIDGAEAACRVINNITETCFPKRG